MKISDHYLGQANWRGPVRHRRWTAADGMEGRLFLN